MAEVFKAKSFGVEGFEKILAIKRILPSLAEDGEFIQMFIDEAKICGQLNHANICQIFELGRVDDAHFIAMEFVWGKDLLQLTNRFRKLRQLMRPEMAAFIGAKVCEGLDYAHKKKDSNGKPLNIIHRDISPQNILCSYEGEVKIIDFGIAKGALRTSKTQAGVLKGKFGYMSPEQVRGLPLDRRSDIFAIGTILYELLVADRLFVGESDFETLERVRNVEVPPLTKVNPAVPATLEKIIRRALTKEVEDRYQWAGEMQVELQSYLATAEPPFAEKSLAGWMRENFAAELKRESDVLEAQRKVGREVLSAPPRATASLPRSIGAAARAPALAPVVTAAEPDILDAQHLFGDSDDSGAFSGEKTTVSEPGFLDETSQPGGALGGQSTRILADRSLAQEAPAAAADALGPQPTVVLGEGTGARAMPKVGPQASTMLGMEAPVLPPRFGPTSTGVVQQQVLTPVGAGELVPADEPPRSSVLRDIATGVGVAAVVVAAILGVRLYLSHAGARGTLVVMLSGNQPAEVLLDGTPRGPIRPMKPVTLKGLAPGEHALLVRAVGGGEFKQSVVLAQGDVNVVTAELHSLAGPGTGQLQLRVANEGAAVWVDGAELAAEAYKQPIPLRADVPHEIRVTKPGYSDVHLAVALKSGETAVREIELQPGLGKLHISTEPAGAEIAVNGRHAGTTPATVEDIEVGKSVRVTLRHRGFQPVIKYISFDKNPEQTLEFKLVASAEDGFAPGAAEAPVRATAAHAVEAHATRKTDPPAAKAGPRPLVAESKEPTALAPLSDGDAPKPLRGDPGYLVANTQPWARVIIDGKDTGKTTPIAPRSKIPLKAGKHVVTFVANGKKYSFDVTIKPNEDTRLIKQLTDN
jgi:serine/threonine protein kinase